MPWTYFYLSTVLWWSETRTNTKFLCQVGEFKQKYFKQCTYYEVSAETPWEYPLGNLSGFKLSLLRGQIVDYLVKNTMFFSQSWNTDRQEKRDFLGEREAENQLPPIFVQIIFDWQEWGQVSFPPAQLVKRVLRHKKLWYFVAFCGVLWHFVAVAAFCGILWQSIAICYASASVVHV